MNRTQLLKDLVAESGLRPASRVFIDGPGSNFAKKNDLVRYKLAFYGDREDSWLRLAMGIVGTLNQRDDVNSAYTIPSAFAHGQGMYRSIIVWFRGRSNGVAPTTKRRDNVPSPVKEYKPVNAKLDLRTVQALVNNENGAAEAVARFALDSMSDCAVEMWEDIKDGSPAPDDVRVREMAADYVEDMLEDLKTEVGRLVLKDLPFEFETKVERRLVVTKKQIG